MDDRMQYMKGRIKFIAWLHICLSLITLFFAFGILKMIMEFNRILTELDAAMTEFIPLYIIILYIMLIAVTVSFIALLVGGYGLLKFANWARVTISVFSIFFLFFIPIGTLIGAYTLRVLFQQETKLLFEHSNQRIATYTTHTTDPQAQPAPYEKMPPD